MPTAGQAVADAMRYVGHPYVWGGWDCSGFVNHVLGQDLGLGIPGFRGGDYKGPPPHGPVVSDWLSTDLCVTVAGPPRPGDLVIYGPDTHIGIAVSGTRFISALDPTLGTRVTPIAGAAPGVLVYRRVKALGRPGRIPAMPKHARPGAAGSVALRLLLLGGAAAGMVLAVVAGVAILSTAGGAAGAGWLATRRTRADY